MTCGLQSRVLALLKAVSLIRPFQNRICTSTSFLERNGRRSFYLLYRPSFCYSEPSADLEKGIKRSSTPLRMYAVTQHRRNSFVRYFILLDWDLSLSLSLILLSFSTKRSSLRTIFLEPLRAVGTRGTRLAWIIRSSQEWIFFVPHASANLLSPRR